jgi:Na+-translocating ferredoxin:NAD+ oxidoreductase RnfA subunit
MSLITLGCVMCAIGFVFFINPYNIVPGGVYGLGIVLHNIFPAIQVGTFGYMFDIPLLTIAIILFSSVREHLEYANYPKAFEGFPIALVTASLLSIAFMGFQGLSIF